MPLVEGAGVPLSVDVHGAGRPTVLVVHGLAATAADHAGLAAALVAAGAEVVVPDRRGYGGSGAPEPYEGTTVEEQAEDVAAVLRALADGPAVVAGDGFGALVALDVMKRHASLVRAAVLNAPPLLQFVPDATEVLAAERVLLEEALREGGPQLAVERWLGAGAPEDAVARARAAHRAFFADYAGLATWPVTRRELRAITVPAVVITPPGAPPHLAAAAEAVAGLLPASSHAVGESLEAAILGVLRS